MATNKDRPRKRKAAAKLGKKRATKSVAPRKKKILVPTEPLRLASGASDTLRSFRLKSDAASGGRLGSRPGSLKPPPPAVFAASVMGSDNRRRARDTEQPPWRSICRLKIKDARGAVSYGTGWFVSARTIITAGHCVWVEGGWARSIDVVPGYAGHGKVGPYGSVTATSSQFRVTDGFQRHGSDMPAADYGAIVLPAGAKSLWGKELGWFPVKAMVNHDIKGARVTQAGYPSDGSKTGNLYWDQGTIKAFSNWQLSYDADTTGGHSGGPIWKESYVGASRRLERTVVGIHNYGAGGRYKRNVATRVNDQVLAHLRHWKTGK